ncbi:uncharacterized protein LOC131073054 [Cryptomeria japonica]|uniref:uncharacterized protein LOC131073054 n=1 Tax=Cryptomeria japonica TaxID=3369 RepID=UPI0027DA8864|nr:uncharacterized protein LOC131073054 [Cryptomeria japonica]
MAATSLIMEVASGWRSGGSLVVGRGSGGASVLSSSGAVLSCGVEPLGGVATARLGEAGAAGAAGRRCRGFRQRRELLGCKDAGQQWAARMLGSSGPQAVAKEMGAAGDGGSGGAGSPERALGGGQRKLQGRRWRSGAGEAGGRGAEGRCRQGVVVVGGRLSVAWYGPTTWQGPTGRTAWI